jgi:putative oxidoreductase
LKHTGKTKNKLMAKHVFTSRGVWDNGLLIVRVFTTIMLYQHGKELFDSKQMADLVSFLSEKKIPSILTYAAKVIELAGSLLIAVGLFTRFITPPLMITMAGVIYTMNDGDIFNGELPFLYILIFLTLFFVGSGKLSLDYFLFDRKRTKKS